MECTFGTWLFVENSASPMLDSLHIFAFVDRRRGEDEILVDPQSVTNRKTFELIQLTGEIAPF